ncbi:MAG: NAD-dependent epimerase/dehydratase family protein [Ardenticatenia bacterium]|nr:NAD-dependent epimerase/dehydratase family protein [Ardenticatenia bacterium]
MRVLVTGAAGFIGSRLSRALLDRAETVIGLDNFDPYYDVRHKRRNVADLLPDPRFTLVEGDLRDRPLVEALFARHRFDAVAHIGALAGVRYSTTRPHLYTEVNVMGSLNIFDAARQHGRPHIVFASTSSVYGNSERIPFHEDDPADRPLAPYPASKRAGELMAHSFHNLWGMSITCVRFFSVYGPHGRPDMMPWQWTEKILRGEPLTLYGGGRLRRDWTYIDDIVAGVIAALERPLGYEIINLGVGQPIENLRFVRRLEELLGRRAHIVDTPTPPSEPFQTFADVSKARRLLGYAPTTPVEEGLARFVAWYLDRVWSVG